MGIEYPQDLASQSSQGYLRGSIKKENINPHTLKLIKKKAD